jgi:tRNA (guanine37-N1)-methyltransferase
MVLMPDVLETALKTAQRQMPQHQARVVALSPVGRKMHQQLFQKTVDQHIHTIFLCGRYEGFDQRFLDHCVDDCWSLGDFVLSGGEFAALVCLDAIARLLPGVLTTASFQQESFQGKYLDYPHYTKPKVFHGQEVPEVLFSGHHAQIAAWREDRARELTLKWRPDLLQDESR